MPAGHCPLSTREKPVVKVDGAVLSAVRPKSDRSWVVHLRKVNGKWAQTGSAIEADKLAKRHGLQGPIDDAFMSAFLFVKPSGSGWNAKADQWAKEELDRAVFEWRRQFRGDAPMKEDLKISEADLAANNLVLWGDPQSNAVLAKIADKLPIQWTKDKLIVNGKTYDAANHVPVLIFPNPLNPQRYVVINSSFTYREYDYLNNARQVPKLPDWAVINLDQPRNSRTPGGIADAGFFGEAWEWQTVSK